MQTGSMWCATVALALVTALAGCGSDGTGAGGGDASTDGGGTGTDASTDGGGTGTDASTDGGGTGTDASTDGGDAGPCEEFTVYADADDDGYGNPDRPMSVCEVPEGYVRDATDCDDERNTVHPGADEYCNDVDDDCDGETDEAGAMDLRTFYRDADGDGYGDPSDTDEDCAPQEGYVADGTDCNDDPMASGADVNPGVRERCDGIDDDCDGTTDEPDAADATVYYADCDRDGYAAPRAASVRSCSAPSAPPDGCPRGGWTTRQPVGGGNIDCYDTNDAANPAATAFSTRDRGDGSFDYDCDGGEERKWPEALCDTVYTTEAACRAAQYVAPRGSTCGQAIGSLGTCRWDPMTSICVTDRVTDGTVVQQECR